MTTPPEDPTSTLDPERRRAARPYLDQALSLADDARASWLQALRDRNPALAADVEVLLDEHGALSRRGFLEASTEALPDPPVIEGREVGAYTIRRLIATGGMGAVYEAWQKQPRRPVALKLMKEGIASRSALRRFEYEAQLLARLRHPGIAQVYEAGTHDDGTGPVPYFAMEYIPKAVAITEYAAANHLTTRQRLELFVKVCEAVHHGHQKGIIHRDLKPSNILVDGTGQPKVIDFGVARSTDSDMALTTLLTSVGQLVGTLQYMSPEQCDADPHDIDTRSDVYTLGVVLYEMLCGRLPYEVSRIAIHEAVRIIRDQEPSRPGTADRELRGDLETIVLKALEKDRRRRYQSAADLALDLQRYLDSDPISARPPSAAYRTQMFVRRHRFGTVAAALAFAGVLAFGVAMAFQAERIARERDRANAEAAKALKVSGFLEDLFGSIDPTRARGKEVTVKEVLDGGRLKIQKELGSQPEVEVPLLRTLGTVYVNLGAYAPAHELLEAAVRKSKDVNGPNARPTLEAERSLAWLLFREGRTEEARAMQEELLPRCRAALGNDDPETLHQLNNLGVLDFNTRRNKEAEALLQEALQGLRRVSGAEHPLTLITMNNLARAYRNLGRYKEAEAICRASLDAQKRIHGPDHIETLMSMDNLAGILNATGRYAEAEAVHRETYALRRRVLGDDNNITLTSLRGVAGAVYNQGRYSEAETLYRQLYDWWRRTHGDEDPGTIGALDNLATAVNFGGRSAEAEVLYRRILELRRKTLGSDHPATLDTLEGLGIALESQGRHEEARAILAEVVEARRRVLGPENPATLQSADNLVAALAHLGRLDEAGMLARETLEGCRRSLGETHPMTRFALYASASVSALRGQKEQALDLLRQASAAGDDLADLPGDADFRSLRGDPEFDRLVAEVKARAAATAQNKP